MESTRSNNKGFSSKGALVPSMVWRLLVSGAMALVFLVVDQVSKMIVRRAVMTGFFSVEVIPGVFGLEFVANRGAAFGLGEGMGWVFVLLAVGVTAFVLVYLLRAPKISRLEVLGMGMVVGGAIGNAIDRLGRSPGNALRCSPGGTAGRYHRPCGMPSCPQRSPERSGTRQ